MGIDHVREVIKNCRFCFMCRHACPTFLATKLDSHTCLLYTSDAADDLLCVDLGGRRIIKKKKKKHTIIVRP